MGFKDDYRDSIDDQYDHERSGRIRDRMQWRRNENYVTLSSDVPEEIVPTFNSDQLSRMTRDKVEEWYRQGVVTQDQYEGFMCVWTTNPPRLYENPWHADTPEVQAIANEILAAIYPLNGEEA